MVYTKRLKAGIGAVRAALLGIGIERQGRQYAEHGEHETAEDAPLVLVACSGGRDSMALAALSERVCAMLGVRCGAVIVDHGMQNGSDEIAAQAAGRCERLGLEPVTVRRVQVLADGRGAEAAARDARYAAICDVASQTGAAAVLLAHTKNDQAETVLIGLLRSGGVDALAGMPDTFVRDGVTFARPLLGMTREDTTGVCEDLGLQWWDDPTNGDASSRGVRDHSLPLRSRIRHGLIPFMEEFAGSDIVDHLAGGARLTRRDKDYLDMQADQVAARAVLEPEPGDAIRLSAGVLQAEHPAIRMRVVAHALAAANIAATASQIESIDRLIADWHGQAAVNLPRGYSAFRQKHVIRVCQDGGHANRRRPR